MQVGFGLQFNNIMTEHAKLLPATVTAGSESLLLSELCSSLSSSYLLILNSESDLLCVILVCR